MKCIRELFLFAAFLLLIPLSSTGQTPKPGFVLSDADTLGVRLYRARNYVRFVPGYHYKARASSDQLRALIDPSLHFDITTISNPSPLEGLPHTLGLPYIPTGSFTSNSSEEISFRETMDKQDFTYLVRPVMWLKTLPCTGNLNGMYQLKDVCSDGVVQVETPAGTWEDYTVPRDRVRSYNFNPAIGLVEGSRIQSLPGSFSDFTHATVIGVWCADTAFAENQTLFGMQGREQNCVMVNKSHVYQGLNAIGGFSYGGLHARNLMYVENGLEDSLASFQSRSARIAAFYKSNRPLHSVWGDTTTGRFYLGSGPDSFLSLNADPSFTGYIPELLVFDYQLDAPYLHSYMTYLAIKYGLSLDTTYVRPNGEVLWDHTQHAVYSHRLTGYGREDVLGLFQKTSTTSYEESPWFSYAYDAHDFADSYHPASSNRLLVMGLQQASALRDGGYFVFGDNNEALSYDTLTLPGSKMLHRRWMLQTNTHQDLIALKDLSWIPYGQNMVFNRKYGKNVYRGDLIKGASSDTSALVSGLPLSDSNGSLSWSIDLEYGPLIAKFGSSQPYLSTGAHDYGYKIDVDGQVYAVKRGVIQPNSLFTVEKGQRLEIQKSRDLVYLIVNGVRYMNTEFLIDANDRDKTYYGVLILGSSVYDFKLLDFRHGGFVSTGHRLELSYGRIPMPEFSSPVLGQIYLLVDTTGRGVFTESLLEYACDELDPVRKKIIFNNVFWDASRSGNYAFTFAYRNQITLRSWSSEDEVKESGLAPVEDVQVYSRRDLGTPCITVRVQRSGGPVRISIHDLSGRIVGLGDYPDGKDLLLCDFPMPMPGVYIVKVRTSKALHTQQILSK